MGTSGRSRQRKQDRVRAAKQETFDQSGLLALRDELNVAMAVLTTIQQDAAQWQESIASIAEIVEAFSRSEYVNPDDLAELTRKAERTLRSLPSVQPVPTASLEGSAALRSGTSQNGKIEEKFRVLAATWHDETDHLSATTERVLHPSYQQIIGLGPAVVPFLLQDLAETHSHWFWALRAITGADPVDPDDVGNVRRMTEAWLDWGRHQGYL